MISPEKLRVEMAAKKSDKVPDGWQTLKEIQVQWDLSEPRTFSLLRSGVEAGMIETKKFRIPCGSGGLLRSVTHYREAHEN